MNIDLTEAIEAAHVFTSTSRARGGGVVENVTSCTCGHPLDWEGRNDQHRRHVLAELVKAVREQVAERLEQIASDRSYDSHEMVTETYLDAARIARGS